MNKITKREARAYYGKIRREERKKVLANFLLLLPVAGIIFWLASCSNQTKTVTEQPASRDLLHQEWDEIYEGVSAPHPPRYYGYNKTMDYEVEYLNGLLNEHGITVFRIEPNNPEHQRRYRRHLEQPDNFYSLGQTEIEMDI